jgi:thiamine-monophosphate kinase
LYAGPDNGSIAAHRLHNTVTSQAKRFATLPALAPGLQLVLSVDTLVEGVHFTADTPLDALGYKCVAVNLSDMAAMGATPRSMQGACSDPHEDTSWSEALQRAIRHAADAVPMSVDLGMVTAPQRQISIQIMGEVPRGEALTRAGACTGDRLWVSGTLGDAGAALALMQGSLRATDREHGDWLLQRLHYPTPRLALGRALRGVATAAIDISDGIAGDALHIAARSKVGLIIFADRLPLSAALLRVAGASRARQFALGAGEDYELAFSAPPNRTAQVQQAARLCRLPVQCIGKVVAGDSLQLLDEQMQDIPLPGAFDHFAHRDAGRGDGDGHSNNGKGTER